MTSLSRRSAPKSNHPADDLESTESTPLLPNAIPPTPLPLRAIVILSIMRCTEPIALTVIFPFINQMIEDLGIAEPTQVGYYAGIIESLFALTTFSTVLAWGRLSDRIGRKPVLLLGLSGAAISVAAFGFSKTFIALVITRCAGGALNGNVAVIKSMLGEISDSSNQGRAFSFLPLSWSIGSVVGPMIGGLLSNPAKNYPSVFGDNRFFLAYPYALPCLVGAFFPIAGAVLGSLYLKETLPRRHQSEEARINIISSTIPSNSTSAVQLPIAEDESKPPPISAVFTPTVFAVLVVYSFLALETIALDALLVLFCYTRISLGGLGFSEKQIGLTLALGGAFTVTSQLLLFPPLQLKYGSVRLYQTFMGIYPVIFALFPVMSWTVKELPGRTVWGVLALFLGLKAVANMSYACNMLVITSAAPSRRLLGSLNGVAQMASSLMRSIGPFAASALFSYSIQHQILGGQLVFLVCFGVAVIAWCSTGLLREGVQGWREAEVGRIKDSDGRVVEES